MLDHATYPLAFLTYLYCPSSSSTLPCKFEASAAFTTSQPSLSLSLACLWVLRRELACRAEIGKLWRLSPFPSLSLSPHLRMADHIYMLTRKTAGASERGRGEERRGEERRARKRELYRLSSFHCQSCQLARSLPAARGPIDPN